MKKVAIGLIGVGLLAMAGLVEAAQLPTTAYWQAPTQRVDKTRLLKADLRGYELRWRETTEGSAVHYLSVPNGNSYKASIPGLETGKSYIIEIAAVDLAGTYSAWVAFPNGSVSSSATSVSTTSSDSSSVPSTFNTPALTPSKLTIQCPVR